MTPFRKPPRKKIAFDNRKLHLSAPCPTAKGKESLLQVNLFSNTPRITVFTNDPEDDGKSKNWGKITAEFQDPEVFFAFLQKLGQIIDGPAGEEDKVKIRNRAYLFPDGQRTEQPVLQSELDFGKDAEGVVWLSVTAKDRPRIKFLFGKSDFHMLYHKSGEQYSKSEQSQLFAKGWIRLMENMMTHMLVTEWAPPKPREDGEGKDDASRDSAEDGHRDETIAAMDEDIAW